MKVTLNLLLYFSLGWFLADISGCDVATKSRHKDIEYQRDAYGNCFAILVGGGQWIVNVPNCPLEIKTEVRD